MMPTVYIHDSYVNLERLQGFVKKWKSIEVRQDSCGVVGDLMFAHPEGPLPFEVVIYNRPGGSPANCLGAFETIEAAWAGFAKYLSGQAIPKTVLGGLANRN